MEGLSIRVRNPFALRESLQVALEVAWPDLPPERVASLKSFLGRLPTLIQPVSVPLDLPDREALLACAGHFFQSRTAYWLRDDFSHALREMERELKSCTT